MLFLCSLSGKCVKLPYGLGAIRCGGGPRAAQEPSTLPGAARGCTGGGGPASLPACISPAPPHQSSPTLPPPGPAVAPGWPSHQPPGTSPSSSPGGPLPTPSLPRQLASYGCPAARAPWVTHSSPHPERPEQQTLSLPESGGRGLRSGCGGPTLVFAGGHLASAPSPPAASALSHACPLQDTAAWG